MGQFTRHKAMLPIDGLMLTAVLVAIIAAFATVLCQRQRLLRTGDDFNRRVGGHAKNFVCVFPHRIGTDSSCRLK